MKALSIRQPWAWLIVNGFKDVENRTWVTGYRGPLLIHAGKAMSRADYEAACLFIESDARTRHVNAILPLPADLERGGIVGQVELVACVRGSESPWFTGDVGFVLRNPQVLPFRPVLGSLGLFETVA